MKGTCDTSNLEILFVDYGFKTNEKVFQFILFIYQKLVSLCVAHMRETSKRCLQS